MTGIAPYSYTRGADSISATEQNGSRQVRRSMTGIAPYSNPRRGGFNIRHGAERQPPSPRDDDGHRPLQHPPRRGGFHIRPHYAVPRM